MGPGQRIFQAFCKGWDCEGSLELKVLMSVTVRPNWVVPGR